MLQVPFGSTGPGWMGLSTPVWFAPTAMESSGSPGTTPLGYAQAGGLAPLAQPAFGGGGLGRGLSLAPTPLSAPFVAADGITAPALMTAIALRRGQPHGPVSDQDVEEFIYDAVEVLTGAGDVEVRCEGGRVTLSGSVPHKRFKRDVGEIAWAIPGINDVQNTVAITTRRRSRAFVREGEAQSSAPGRKQA